MIAMRTKTLALTAILLVWCGRPLRAGVIVLANGVSPTPQYAGCTDTWISDESWEQGRDYGRRPTLRCGGKRRILIRFDLSPIPKGQVIHKAILAMSDVGYPQKRGGKWPVSMLAYRLTRQWHENANWLEHTRTNYKAADEGDWKTPGGEMDLETDFGQEQKGVIAADKLAAGRWGHEHDLDITAMVRQWYSGKRPNHGLALAAPAKSHGCQVAGSQWHVPRFRPRLLIDIAAKGMAPTGIGAVKTTPDDIPLDPISEMSDGGKGDGRYATVRVGQNANCALRGASTDAYIKEAVGRYPGTWGWMTACRVGGVAGDFSRALLYFDLSEIPNSASIKQAKLHLRLVHQTSRQVTAYRYGAFLVKLPDAPGWAPEAVTAAHRKAGAAWRPGGLTAASGPKPLALGKVITREIEVHGQKRRVPAAMEFDLTGAVRAWVQGGKKVPNCGIVLDNRIEGGQYDFYNCRSFRPELRPYMEITLSPAIRIKPAPIKVRLAAPVGDYWVEPMRQVHRKFKGKAGTLAQYGDSITVTMAFLAPHTWQPRIRPKNCPPDVQKELDALVGYTDRTLWRKWKGGEWGNTGMMKSNWLLDNIDPWQKKMNPEVSVIMFGTNDIGSIWPPEYTENMAAAIRRMLADGTVPMLTSIPPANKGGHREYWLAALSISHGLKVPLIDYYGEIVRRRPDDWNGRLDKFKDRKGYQVLTLVSGDGTHPSNPKEYQNDFSEKALSTNGFNLRNYMTLRMYYQVMTKVLEAKGR